MTADVLAFAWGQQAEWPGGPTSERLLAGVTAPASLVCRTLMLSGVKTDGQQKILWKPHRQRMLGKKLPENLTKMNPLQKKKTQNSETIQSPLKLGCLLRPCLRPAERPQEKTVRLNSRYERMKVKYERMKVKKRDGPWVAKDADWGHSSKNEGWRRQIRCC